MTKEFSPEERLLRLIKGKKRTDVESDEGKQAEGNISDASTEKAKQDSIKEKIPQQVLPEKEQVQNSQKVAMVKRPITLPWPILISSILAVTVIGMLVFFVVNIISNKDKDEISDLKAIIESISKMDEEDLSSPARADSSQQDQETHQARTPNKREDIRAQDSFSEYQKLLSQKSIFAPAAGTKSKVKVQAGPELRSLVREIRLVGILPGVEPQAIIEDKKSGQTLFLKKGEYIDKIEIKEISSGKVILAYGEETITLSL